MVQEGLSISTFQVLPLISCLICIPNKHPFCSFSEGESISAPVSHSVLWLVWFQTLHVLGEKHLYFWWLVGFSKSCLQLWLGGLFTLNLRSGEGAGSTQAGAHALGQSDQEQSLLFLHWTLGCWGCITCTHSFRAPGFNSQELYYSAHPSLPSFMHIKLQQTVFSGFSRKHYHRISIKYLFFTVLWHNMGQKASCYDAF